MKAQKDLEAVTYLTHQIVVGVVENDKDSIRSHLEDLNGYLSENNLLAE